MQSETYISTHYGYCYYDLDGPIIYNLYVYKKYRRNGYAKRLLQYVISKIRQSGYEGKIYIQARPRENSIDKIKLIEFYKSLDLSTLL